jgi:hypothetical protein
LTLHNKSCRLPPVSWQMAEEKHAVRRVFVKRLLLCFVLALLTIQLCILPAMASVYQEWGGVTLPYTASGVDINTLPATDVSQNSATLNASVSMASGKANDGSNLIYVDSLPVTGYFQYGTASGVYTQITAPISKSYSSSLTFTSIVNGLRPCTTYFARFIISSGIQADCEKQYNDYLISFLSSGLHSTGMHGLGVGLGFSPNVKFINSTPRIYPGNEITFTTTGCQISTGPLGQGGSVGTGSTAISTPGPIQMSSIVVQSAAITTPKVAPGEKVDVAASITNKGSSNGDAKVTLYVNGQEVESQGITLSSGQTAPLHFYLSRNEPGTYSVTVGGVSAGSFTVDTFANNDSLIYGIIALFTIGIAAIIYMVTRKRTA